MTLRLRTRLVSALCAVAMLCGLSLMTSAPPADAVVLTRCGSSGCNLYQYGPGSGFFFVTPGFTSVRMVCWTTGPVTNGTGKWFKIRNIYGTGTNWTPATNVIFQTTVPHC